MRNGRLLIDFQGVTVRIISFVAAIIAFFKRPDIAEKICLTVLWAFVLYFAYLIMHSTGMFIWDDARALASSLAEPHFRHFANEGGSRWCPLRDFDLNLAQFLPYYELGKARFFLNSGRFALLIFFLYKLLPAKTAFEKYISVALLLAVPFITPAFVDVFAQPQFPETLLMVCLAFFMFAWARARERESGLWYTVAIFAAVFATYQKEVVFGMFLVIAVFDWLFGKRTKYSKLFDLVLVCNAVLFLASWYMYSVSQSQWNYHTVSSCFNLNLSYFEILQSYFKNLSPVTFVILSLSIWRGIAVLFLRDRTRHIVDGFLFASVSWIVGYLILKGQNSYFLVPAVILALPAFIAWVVTFKWFKMLRVCIMCIIVHNLYLGTLPKQLLHTMHLNTSSYIFIDEIIRVSGVFKKPVVLIPMKKSWTPAGIADLYRYLTSDKYNLGIKTNNEKLQYWKQGDEINNNAIYIILNSGGDRSLEGHELEKFIERGFVEKRVMGWWGEYTMRYYLCEKCE